LARRFFISAAEISTSRRRFLTSMTMMSPLRMAAMGPRSAASGTMWAIMKPWVAPEKRPSVMSAHRAAEPRALQRPGDVEHLPHPGAALSGPRCG
jgi:hypothetical protein